MNFLTRLKHFLMEPHGGASQRVLPPDARIWVGDQSSVESYQAVTWASDEDAAESQIINERGPTALIGRPKFHGEGGAAEFYTNDGMSSEVPEEDVLEAARQMPPGTFVACYSCGRALPATHAVCQQPMPFQQPHWYHQACAPTQARM